MSHKVLFYTTASSRITDYKIDVIYDLPSIKKKQESFFFFWKKASKKKKNRNLERIYRRGSTMICASQSNYIITSNYIRIPTKKRSIQVALSNQINK